MRIALLSDIHGNATALNAVLADVAEQGGADGYWIMGDLVALGPEPVLTLEILSALPDARFVRGNTDRYVCTGIVLLLVLRTQRAILSCSQRSLRLRTRLPGHREWLPRAAGFSGYENSRLR